MRPAHRARARGIAAPALAALLLSGCSTQVAAAPAAAPHADAPGVELVVGVHANGPAPVLTPGALAAVSAAIADEQSVGVVAVDGRPRELQKALPMSVTGVAAGDRIAADRANRRALLQLVQQGRAAAPGADLFTALIRAASAAHAAVAPVDRLLVLDSGLSDRGPLDLAEPGATEATPALVADRLIRIGALRRDSFSGLTVDFTGLGTAVAPPQSPLPPAQVTGVRAIYAAVVLAGGGTPVLRDDLLVTKPSGSASPVGVVRPADGRIALGGSNVLGDGSSIGFLPGTSTFRDPVAARRLLTPLAAWLTASSGHRATVVGRTSSEGAATKAQDLALSVARAAAVRDLLVRLGAAPSLITARGEGYAADPPDRVHGVLDPAKAALNRVVRITTVA